ncbi:hypothetical protein ABPG72_015108 [Tetrahymena utriculariae]
MGNNNQSGSKSSSQSISPKQSSNQKQQNLQKEKENLQKILASVSLRCENKLNDKSLHEQRSNFCLERENRINKEFLSKTVHQTQQDENENKSKNLSSKQVEEIIQFNLISETNEVSIKKSASFVCGINLHVKQPKEQSERVPMDLICVIDDSGSMSGKKAQLVRKSLKYLLKIMNENDRICLISFDSVEKILTPFLRNTLENKSELKKAIKNIVGRGSTNIEAGMEAGLWMIKNRKEKNPITCMFLLSDGQDDGPQVDLRVQKLISSYDIQDTFIVNTYGYGADHDATQMRKIAETHKGGYYYIEDIKKVSEWFVLSISGLLSAVGEDVRIRIKTQNSQQTKLAITQVYGGDQLWVKQDYEKGVFEIYLPHLVIGDNKFFVFDLQFNSEQFKLNDQNRSLAALEAELEIKAVKEEQIIRKNDILQIEFKDADQDQLNSNFAQTYYEEMMVTHSRAVGGLKIKQANQLINQKQDYTQAKAILQQYKEEMNSKNTKLKDNNGLKHLDEDLDEAIEKCAPKLYRQASFDKMEVIHCQRRNSIAHQEDWNECQQVIMGKFKNNDICLSDDSCSDDENDAKIKQVQTKSSQQNPVLRQQYSDEYLSDSGDDDDEEDKQNKKSPKINNHKIQRRLS